MRKDLLHFTTKYSNIYCPSQILHHDFYHPECIYQDHIITRNLLQLYLLLIVIRKNGLQPFTAISFNMARSLQNYLLINLHSSIRILNQISSILNYAQVANYRHLVTTIRAYYKANTLKQRSYKWNY
jgi:hypothetical protein